MQFRHALHVPVLYRFALPLFCNVLVTHPHVKLLGAEVACRMSSNAHSICTLDVTWLVWWLVTLPYLSFSLEISTLPMSLMHDGFGYVMAYFGYVTSGCVCVVHACRCSRFMLHRLCSTGYAAGQVAS